MFNPLVVLCVTGAAALIPTEPVREVVYGEVYGIELVVYAAADPPLLDSEIVWRRPSGAIITTGGGRLSLVNGNKRLVILNVGLGDNGAFRVEIVRENSWVVQMVEDSANISVNVYGKFIQIQNKATQ